MKKILSFVALTSVCSGMFAAQTVEQEGSTATVNVSVDMNKPVVTWLAESIPPSAKRYAHQAVAQARPFIYDQGTEFVVNMFHRGRDMYQKLVGTSEALGVVKSIKVPMKKLIKIVLDHAKKAGVVSDEHIDQLTKYTHAIGEHGVTALKHGEKHDAQQFAAIIFEALESFASIVEDISQEAKHERMLHANDLNTRGAILHSGSLAQAQEKIADHMKEMTADWEHAKKQAHTVLDAHPALKDIFSVIRKHGSAIKERAKTAHAIVNNLVPDVTTQEQRHTAQQHLETIMDKKGDLEHAKVKHVGQAVDVVVGAAQKVAELAHVAAGKAATAQAAAPAQ